jgi:SAM-dependent methyltransferase
MVDLGFPAGRFEFAPRIYKVGSDAGRLDAYYADGSVDFVCSHNAFEHFNGDSDTRSIQEIARILTPGGVALITPFFTAQDHTVSINPFASYVAADSMDLAESVDLELAEEPGSKVGFNLQMISPYARAYSFASAQRRLIDSVSGVTFRLLVVDFDDEEFEKLSGELYQGVPIRRDIYRGPAFVALEISKEG